MHCHLVQSLEDLRTHRDDWEQIQDPNPFLNYSWMMAWLNYRESPLPVSRIEPFVLVVTDGETLNSSWIGIAPFCLVKSKFGTQLQFMSSDKACADYLSLVCRDDDFVQVADELVGWLEANLMDGPYSFVDSIELAGICLAESRAEYFLDRLSIAGFDRYVDNLESCWVVDLPDTWEVLNAQFNKSHRRKTNKAVKRINGANAKVVSSCDVGVEAVWDTFVDLHQQRRVFLGEPGCFADSGFEKFLLEATLGLADDDRAEILLVSLDEKPLAAQLLLKSDQATWMYQSGSDPTRNNLEPGYIVTTLAIQRAIESGFKQFDFLRGDEPYKARWNSRPNQLSRAKMVSPQFSSRFKHQIWSSGKSFKSWIKSWS